MHPPLAAAALAGFLAAVTGTYWDDAWHTEKGRDSFLIAPHVVLYSGVAVAGAAMSAWGLLVARREGLAAALRRPPLALGLTGVAVTMASGPIDNVWHEAFGRDAVVWSPPHMLGVAGTLGIAAGLLLELGRMQGRAGRALAALAGAGVIGAATVPVLEYETDVPQFDEVWYLPVLALGVAVAFAAIAASDGRRGAVLAAAAVHAAVIGIVSAGLEAGGMPGPALPLLVVPAAAFELLRLRRAGVVATAAAVTVVLFAAYVPYLNVLRADVELGVEDVAFGLPLAFAAAWVALRALSGRAPAPALALAVAGAVGVALAAPGAALAHDPGQGDEVGQVRLAVDARDGVGVLQALVESHAGCEALRARTVVARRAGETIRGPLAVAGPSRSGCSLRGAVPLPERGRWFVYAELDLRGRRVEAWVPVVVSEDGGGSRREQRELYEPAESGTSAVQVAAGLALYALVLAMLGAIGVACRRAGRPA